MTNKIAFTILAILLLSQTPSTAQIKPERIAFYYGFPSLVNGSAGDINAAKAVFDDYEMVILGAWLHLPQHDPNDPNSHPDWDNGCVQNAHYDHNKSKGIINLLTPSTSVLGYVSIGGENTWRTCDSIVTPLTEQEIKTAIDQWKGMGVTGIFLDEAGYDFGTTRARQNMAINYSHNEGLTVFINAWDSDDILGDAVVGTITYSAGNLSGQTSSQPMNPNGVPTALTANDILLLESYQIMYDSYENPTDWKNRADKALNYKNTMGIKVATLTTISDTLPAGPCNNHFDQAKFDYAWWSTLLYGFDYMSWGEPNAFSASGPCDSELPFRSPSFTGSAGTSFSSNSVSHNGDLHTRNTDTGVITVNTSTHTGQFSSAFTYFLDDFKKPTASQAFTCGTWDTPSGNPPLSYPQQNQASSPPNRLCWIDYNNASNQDINTNLILSNGNPVTTMERRTDFATGTYSSESLYGTFDYINCNGEDCDLHLESEAGTSMVQAKLRYGLPSGQYFDFLSFQGTKLKIKENDNIVYLNFYIYDSKNRYWKNDSNAITVQPGTNQTVDFVFQDMVSPHIVGSPQENDVLDKIKAVVIMILGKGGQNDFLFERIEMY